MASRPARHAHGPGGLHLCPNPPPDLVGFGDDALLVHRQHLAVAHDELTVHHHRLDVGWLTVVDHAPTRSGPPARGGRAACPRPARRPSCRPRACRPACPAAPRARLPVWRPRARLPAAAEPRETDRRGEMRSVSSAIRITSNRSLVLLSVPLAIGQPAARSAGDGRDDAAIRGHVRLVRNDRPRLSEQRDIGIVDISAVRGEQPRAEEAVPVEKRRRPKAMVLLHEIDFGDALVQVNRVAEIVLLGKGAHGLQQFRRRRSRRARRRGRR